MPTRFIGGTIADQLAALDGLITEEVGARLSELAAVVAPDHCIVEIGSYRGKSTCYLAAGATEGFGAKVWAIDPWDLEGNPDGRHSYRSARAEFDRQIAAMELGSHITPVQGFSTQVAGIWREPIGMLFIDGSHEYADIRNDWYAWKPHLMPAAIVAFDDYDTPRNPGVKRLVDELVDQGELAELDISVPPLAVGVAKG